jgi:hypothetical protein
LDIGFGTLDFSVRRGPALQDEGGRFLSNKQPVCQVPARLLNPVFSEKLLATANFSVGGHRHAFCIPQPK